MNRFSENTWYYCEKDDFYFKYYAETTYGDYVDFVFVDKKNKEHYKSRVSLTRMNTMRHDEFTELSPSLQNTMGLLYE